MASRRRDRTRHLHAAAVLLAGVLTAIHVYLGLAVERFGSAASVRFLVIGGVFLLGVGVYLSPYFRPVLYLLGSLYAGFLGLLWILGGMKYLRLGVLAGLAGTGFLLLTTYLFLREETFTAGG